VSGKDLQKSLPGLIPLFGSFFCFSFYKQDINNALFRRS